MSKKRCTNSDLNELIVRIDERVQVLPKIVSDIEIIKELQIKDHFRIKALEEGSISFRYFTKPIRLLLRSILK